MKIHIFMNTIKKKKKKINVDTNFNTINLSNIPTNII